MPEPYRICFVCLGNICRSPMAEVVTRSLLEEAELGDRVTVASTGTGDWHIGNPANPGSVRALAARGYDASRHRAQQLTSDRLADYDLLVGLDTANLSDIERLLRRTQPEHRPEVALLRDFVPGGEHGLGVPDPYGMGDAAFQHALDLVEEACRGLIAELGIRLLR
ncbi:MAG: low molecular weight phosphotyrosine protein phosphatase [Geodermatophilaceae bacterium]|nr:low molecular weight phosphotyrosine protein phosphatase [Geodermatophilaceae bacterium]